MLTVDVHDADAARLYVMKHSRDGAEVEQAGMGRGGFGADIRKRTDWSSPRCEGGGVRVASAIVEKQTLALPALPA